MSITGLSTFDDTLHKTNTWLKEIMDQTGWEERHRAYMALRATLHALRDRLGVDEAAHLGAQLPMLVRGFYYEGWHPAGTPSRERSREAFLGRIRHELGDRSDIDPEAAARAVFAVLQRHIAAGEAEDVRHSLPGPVRELWPA